MAKGLQIGEFAKRLGLTPKTVRFYESVGLLAEPARTESGYRLYGDDDIERLRFIQGAKSLGLSLKEIKDIVETWSSGERPCAHVRGLLMDKLGELDRRIQELTTFRDELSSYMGRMAAVTGDSSVPCVHIAGVVAGAWSPSVAEPPPDTAWKGPGTVVTEVAPATRSSVRRPERSQPR